MSKALTACAVAAALAAGSIAAHAQMQGKPSMPEGRGKQLVEALCSSCHALQLINNSSG